MTRRTPRAGRRRSALSELSLILCRVDARLDDQGPRQGGKRPGGLLEFSDARHTDAVAGHRLGEPDDVDVLDAGGGARVAEGLLLELMRLRLPSANTTT